MVYPFSVSVVASVIANGTFRIFARAFTMAVFTLFLSYGFLSTALEHYAHFHRPVNSDPG